MSSLLKTCSGLDTIVKNTYVKDVFNITYYKGINLSFTLNNTFDMSNGEYLVKIKNKDAVSDHLVYDTLRDITKEIYTNKPSSEVINLTGLTAFTTKGFTIGNSKTLNQLSEVFSAITFKKAEKFFDIVQYTGDGTIDRSITHALNCDIGMISIKALDIYSNWIIRHKDATGELLGDQSYKQTESFTQITEISKTNFKVANNANLLGIKYIAYLYAHDSTSTGKIQCGSYTGGYQDLQSEVIGVGKLPIPDDVKEITITCSGGTGGSNVWYDPGKPYIPGTPEKKFIAPTYAWQYINDYFITTAPVTNLEQWNSFSHSQPDEPQSAPTAISIANDPTTSVYVEWWTGTMDNPVFHKGHYSSYLVDVGQEFVAGVETQDYVAPSSGGDVYSGGYSKVVVNGETHVFEGGSAGKATPETKTIVLREELDRFVEYDIAVGGKLIYAYKTGGPTQITFMYDLPSDKFEATLAGKGSIEIPKGVKEVKIVGKGGLGSNDTYISKGQPLIEPTYLVRGQPYIPYDPGQEYKPPTAAVAEQQYIPDTRWSTPEVNNPAGWRYDDFDIFSYSYWADLNIYSKFVQYDPEDYILLEDNVGPYKLYSSLAPGANMYYWDRVTNKETTQIANTVSLTTIRTGWYSRKVIGNSTITFTTDQTYYQAEYVPAASGGTAGQPYRAAVPASPGQPYIAPTPEQPYIETVYLDRGQEYIAPVYLNPGQPYIAPTPYDPGQPYIAAVVGQPFVAPTAEIKEEGNINYPNGLPPYVAGVTGSDGEPEKIIPAGWQFDDEQKALDHGFKSKYFKDITEDIYRYYFAFGYYDADGKVILDELNYPILAFIGDTPPVNAVTQDQLFYTSGPNIGKKVLFKFYYKRPPGTLVNGYVADAPAYTYVDTGEVFSRLSSSTSMYFNMTYSVDYPGGGGESGTTDFKCTWYPEVIIPAKPPVTGVTGQGNINYPNGLPKYVAYRPATAGQPYIAAVKGQPYIAPTPSSPGQPYVPPVIGKGDLLGDPTSISINSNTFTFPGAMGWDPVVSYTNVLKLSGENSQSLVFNVAPSGSLRVSYDIPNSDVTTKANFKPYYLVIKKITDSGDWIEIDTKRSNFSLKLNKNDSEIINEMVTITKDGIILNSIAVNEANQKYVYMVIRG